MEKKMIKKHRELRSSNKENKKTYYKTLEKNATGDKTFADKADVRFSRFSKKTFLTF